MFLKSVDVFGACIREGNIGPVGVVELYESSGKLLLDVAGVMLGYCFFDGFKDGFAVELLGVAEVNRKEHLFDEWKTLQVIQPSVLIEESSEAEMKDIPDCKAILLLDLQLQMIF